MLDKEPEHYYKVTITQSNVVTEPFLTRRLEIDHWGRLEVRSNDLNRTYQFKEFKVEKVQ